jgi:hypothetical protein
MHRAWAHRVDSSSSVQASCIDDSDRVAASIEFGVTPAHADIIEEDVALEMTAS